MMRIFKLMLAGLLLSLPALAMADVSQVPGSATWYLHVDLQQMKTAEAGQAVYRWMEDEIFDEVKEEAGVDFGKELDRLTAYSLQGQGPVFLFEGDISQESKDKVMTFIAAQGDLKALKSSGTSYYRLTSDDSGDGDGASIGNGNIEIDIESLEKESWVSLDLKNRVLVTSSEPQMKALLKNGGKIAGDRSHKGALVVLTAEKALLQAGMNSGALADDNDGDSGWDSNILRNTEQVAFLVAAAANKLAVEAQLITTEPDMAQSLASVVRGLISLISFDDDMDPEAVKVLQGTTVEAKGNALSISLAIDPQLVVSTLSD
jgi:hypothetical protein